MVQSQEGFKTVKDVALYFHSSFRNVGLYTSLSLASLAAASTYAKDREAFHPALVFTSCIFLLISLVLNVFLWERIRTISNQSSGVTVWLMPIYMMFALQIGLLVFGGYQTRDYMGGLLPSL
jgi:hypothetical protein